MDSEYCTEYSTADRVAHGDQPELSYLILALPEHLLFAEVVDAEKPADTDEHASLVGTDGRGDVFHLCAVHQLQTGALVHQSAGGDQVTAGHRSSPGPEVIHHTTQYKLPAGNNVADEVVTSGKW